jgi:hypothetical protein
VTDLPLQHADVPPEPLASEVRPPAAADHDREAEHRAAQLRAQDVAAMTTGELATGETPAVPTKVETELHHDLHFDDLLPRRSKKRRISLR